jgi:hypothetical protein
LPTPPRRSAPLLLAALTACGGGAPTAFGPTPAVARAHASEFLGGLAVRFENVRRTPKFEAARARISRDALNPSRLVRDTSVWTTAPADGARYLELEARPGGGHYTFTAHAGARAPDRPGAARHVIRLAPVADGVYQWNTVVEHAVGRTRATDVAGVVMAALARLERPEPELRAELRTTLPRTGAALGRLMTLDRVTSAPVGDGSTRVELRGVLRPDRLATTMPAFAAFVRKYVSDSRLDLAVEDGRGGRWLDVRAARDTVVVRLRLHDGRLLAFDGPARPMPARAELRTSAVTHYSIFDVGATNLVGDLTTVRAAHERGWQVRWHRAPSWKIPLGMRHLINGSLNRPFAGEGMQMALTLRDGEGVQTVLARRFDVTVQESAIVRWLGGLGSKAMNDLAGRAEVEQDRFTAELLRAMAADVTAAIPAG